MARKNILRQSIVSAQSLAASFQTVPTVVSYLDNCSYQINITTSNSTGTFTVQGSSDYAPRTPEAPGNTGNWVDLPLGGPTANPVAAAANDSILINLNQIPFNALRVSYTPTIAGTGTCEIWTLDKQIGG